MRYGLFICLIFSLLYPEYAEAEKVSIWIILRDESVLTGETDCESRKLCGVRLDDYTAIAVGYGKDWENLFVALDIDDPSSDEECCKFAPTGREFLVVRRPRNYLKKYIYYMDNGVFPMTDARYATLYVRIAD